VCLDNSKNNRQTKATPCKLAGGKGVEELIEIIFGNPATTATLY